jgi:hypothetical protein
VAFRPQIYSDNNSRFLRAKEVNREQASEVRGKRRIEKQIEGVNGILLTLLFMGIVNILMISIDFTPRELCVGERRES